VENRRRPKRTFGRSEDRGINIKENRYAEITIILKRNNNIGIMWGKRGDFKGCLKAGMPVILIMMLIPGINGLLHLYCYLLGYIWFKLFSYTKKVLLG
jgi:hypothetical protein